MSTFVKVPQAFSGVLEICEGVSMESLIITQLAVSGEVWASGVTRFGVRTCRDIICLTTAGAVAHGFLAMGGFVRGTGGGRFAPLSMTYSYRFTGAPAESSTSRNHSQIGMSCSLVWSP